MRLRRRVTFLGTEETFIPAAIPGPGYWSDAKAERCRAQTGGRVHGLVPTMHPIPINGSCIRNWAGSSQARVWIPESGFGRMD